MEVIVTGKLTTYPGSSQYQIIIEPGAGGRRRAAGAPGAAEEARGRGPVRPRAQAAVAVLPAVIGVVTCPTGAVIRDILHRIADRLPCRVIVWPVAVQGEKAAGEVAAAIEASNALPADGPVPRPDVLIVARGGGSLEDLWAFNEEIVVRAAAAGHPADLGRRPRDRHHPDRLRLRPPRAHADRGRRDRRAGTGRSAGRGARLWPNAPSPA